ncbi:MAG: HAD-IB family phosphatase [Patescibacteria group bacterium]|nr:HAD-IB family phosphatase [Patescibacteria group bacterium]
MTETPAAERPIAAFDIDGTIYRGNSLTRLAQRLCERRFLPEGMAKLLFRFLFDRECREGAYRDNDRKIVNTLLMALRGKTVEELAPEVKLFIIEAQSHVHEFPLELLHALKPTHDSVAVTGGLRETAHGLTSEWGFDVCFASELEVRNGAYTGAVASTPVNDKSAAIRRWMSVNPGLTLKGSVGIGDTASDIPMLEMIETPIAFNPDSKLAEKAEMNRWPVVIERKDNIYVVHAGKSLRFSATEVRTAISHVLHALRSLRALQ